MTRKELRARCKELTMGCWWPSRAFPRKHPNWPQIASELATSALDELNMRDNLAKANELRKLAEFAEAQI